MVVVSTGGLNPIYPSPGTLITLGTNSLDTHWTAANSPWDLSTSSQPPALKYLTDATATVTLNMMSPPAITGVTVTYTCTAADLPTGIDCDTLLPGQR